MISINNKKLLFLFLLVLSSCSQFATYVDIKNEKDEIDSDEPIYFYYAQHHFLPDSVEYVGDFTVELKGPSSVLYTKKYTDSELFPITNFPFRMEVRYNLENECKDAGANLVYFNNGSEPREFFNFQSGKFYRVKNMGISGMDMESIKKLWKSRTPDKYEGIYQMRQFDVLDEMRKEPIRYALVKTSDNKYSLIYLDGFEDCNTFYGFTYFAQDWKEGDVLAYLDATENPSIFTTKKYDWAKYLEVNCITRFDDNNIRIYSEKGTEFLQKVFPNKGKYESREGSLTGFGINNNKIVTCFHGTTALDTKLYIRGINGNFTTKYEAIVEKVDKENDLAVLSLVDKSIQITSTPLTANETEKITADEVFVLGYPLSSLMGDELKLTNGLISANSGIAGISKFYQISAPIQPGNSGSPLFDKEGNVIGVCTSAIPSANNVGYCVKQRNVNNFLKNNGYSFASTDNSLKNAGLQDKVKSLKNSIFLIEIINNNPMRGFSIENNEDEEMEEFDLNEDD